MATAPRCLAMAQPVSLLVIVLPLALLLSGCVGTGDLDPTVPTGEPSPDDTMSNSSSSSPDPSPPAAPPPGADQPLATIVLRYGPSKTEGAIEASFEVPKGASRLSFTVVLNAPAAGLYFVEPGPDCLCDPRVTLGSPKDSGIHSEWSQIFASSYTANNAPGPQVVEGPFDGSLTFPIEGMWTLHLWGVGQNLEAEFTGSLEFG